MSQITQFSQLTTIPIPVSQGGTGDTTLLNHAVLLGAGTNPVNTTAVGATGTVLIGNTAADPSFSATPSVTSISIANAPVLGTDGANKTYVDAIAAGLTFKAPCLASTTANLTATYANGAVGIGATLTNSGALAAFSVDGVTPAVTSRILVKNQSSTFQNGIYTVTTAGSGAIAWVLTRATDYNTPAQINAGSLVPVSSGTANTNTIWIQTATVTTIGTDPIVFSLFSQPGVVTITGDTGGALTGTNITFTAGTTGLSFGGAGTTETLSGTLIVSNGGTGRATLTNHGVLIGAGTTAITQLAAASTGTVLTGVTGADPAFSTTPSVTSISIANAPTVGTDGANMTYVDSGSPFIMRVATVIMSSATLKTLRASPVTIVAAPGANKTIMVLSSTCKLNYGGNNAFVNGGGGTIQASYGGNAGNVILAQVLGASQISLTANRTALAWSGNTPVTQNSSVYENTAITLINSSATEYSGNAAGDNTIGVSICYYIATLT